MFEKYKEYDCRNVCYVGINRAVVFTKLLFLQQVLINDVEHLAVLFYAENCEECEEVLEELETIDDDTDSHGIQFVKSKDSKLASEIGIFSFPALVYYETGVPIMYDGKRL